MSGLTGGDGDPDRMPSWASADTHFLNPATGQWERKADQSTVTSPPPAQGAQAEFDADGKATGNWFGNGGTYLDAKYVTPEQQRWRASQGLKPFQQNQVQNGHIFGKQEEGIDHISKSGQFMKTAVPIVLSAMAGYGAMGAAGMLGEGLGVLGAAPGEAAGSFTGSALPNSFTNALQYGNYASKAANIAGQLTGNEGLSKIGQIGGMATGLGSGVNTLGNGFTSGNLMDILKGATGTYSAGTNIANAINGNNSPTGSHSSTGSRTMQNPLVPQSQGSAPRSWLDDLLGVGAGLQSERQNREAFVNLNNLFSRREEARAPYETALARSYSNPEDYLNGADYKAAAAIANNNAVRKDAGRGGLSNDYGRMLGSQQHALAGLEKYREGLRSSLSQEQLPYELFRDAQTRNARAGGPTAGGIGYGGASAGIIKALQSAGVNGQTMQGILKALGIGGQGQGDPPTGSNPDYGGGDSNPEMDYPYSSDTPYSVIGQDTPFSTDPGAFDPSNIDWEDTSWMNGVTGLFDT